MALPEPRADDRDPAGSPRQRPSSDDSATVDPAAHLDAVLPSGNLPTHPWEPRVYRPRRWLSFVVAAVAAAAVTVGLLLWLGHR
jgi:hypothetical protein